MRFLVNENVTGTVIQGLETGTQLGHLNPKTHSA